MKFCGWINCSRESHNGWSFPKKVRSVILREVGGKSVLHLFGGMADFGLRLDLDPIVRPDVIGDAWLPPFAANSFDVVILDPPYVQLNTQEKNALLRQATIVAREFVVWFHTMWIDWVPNADLERFWFVAPSNMASCRVLSFFRVRRVKSGPVTRFVRGPGLRYNRWLAGAMPLPFD